MYYDTYDLLCKMRQRGSRWGKSPYNKVTYKLVKNQQSLNGHHVKRIRPTGFIFRKHSNDWHIKLFIYQQYILLDHIVEYTGWLK